MIQAREFESRKEARKQSARANKRTGSALELSSEEKAEIKWIAAEGGTAAARRARIVLMRAEGKPLAQIARSLGVDRATARRWVRRFQTLRLRGLVHASLGKSRKRRFDATVRDAIARIAVHSPRDVGESFDHWSLRRLHGHVLRRGVVARISVEGLRQLLHGVPLPSEFWKRSASSSFELADQQRAGLERLAQEGGSVVARRAQMLLARASGLSEDEVAAGFGVGRLVVRRWVRRFQRHGILGLQTQRGRHGPNVFTADIRRAIAQVARNSPKRYGEMRERWSLRSLRSVLMRTGVVGKISVQHLRRILQQEGVVADTTRRSVGRPLAASA